MCLMEDEGREMVYKQPHQDIHLFNVRDKLLR